MNEFAPLVADAGEVVGVIVGVIFVIFAVIGQIVTKMREGEQQRQQQRQRQQLRQGQPAARPDAQPKPLEDEVRQFLRAAADRRGAAQEQPRQARSRPKRQPVRPVEAQAADAEPIDLRDHIKARESRQLTSGLTTDLARTDEKMASHVHEVFDHKLGSLEGTPGDTAQLSQIAESESPEDQISSFPSSAVAGLAAMFATADGVRQAILVHEILDRPEHRWS